MILAQCKTAVPHINYYFNWEYIFNKRQQCIRGKKTKSDNAIAQLKVRGHDDVYQQDEVSATSA